MNDYELEDDSGSCDAFDPYKTLESDEGIILAACRDGFSLSNAPFKRKKLCPLELQDTADASETDQAMKNQECAEMKEQVYQEKLANLKEQLRQLQDHIHPEYLERLQKLEEKYVQDINVTMDFQKIALERVEWEYEQERLAAHQEFEEKKIALKKHLIRELEEKKKLIEAERDIMDLTCDVNLLEMTELPIIRKLINEGKGSLHFADLALIRSLLMEDINDQKPIQTRRLRRKASESAPAPEKKRKLAFNQINFLLDEKEIEEDLELIRACTSTSNSDDNNKIFQNQNVFEVKVEDGKLHYDKKGFRRGQTVYYEVKDNGNKYAGMIFSINSSEVCIKRNSGRKVQISLPQLQSGAIILKKRAA